MRSIFLLLGSCAFAAIGAAQPFSLTGTALGIVQGSETTFFVGTAAGLYRGAGGVAVLHPAYLEPAGTTQPAVRQIFVAGAAVFVRTEGAADEVWASADFGRTWSRAMSGLPAQAEIDELAHYPGTQSLVALVRTPTSRGFYRTDDGGASWTLLSNPPGVPDEFGISAANPNLMFYNSGRAIYRSLDGGRNWAIVGSAPFVSDEVNSPNFIFPDPANASVVVMGGGGASARDKGVFRSTDQGGTWTMVQPGNAIRGIADPEWRFLISVNSVSLGDFDLSVNRGQTWSEVQYSDLSSGSPAAVVADPDGKLYLTSNGGRYFQSENNGFEWSEIESTVVPTLAAPPEPILVEVRKGIPARTGRLAVRTAESASWEVPIVIEDPGVSWLTLDQTMGTTGGSAPTFTVSPAGLEVGEYEATIRVTSDQTANGAVEFLVVLRVTEAPSGPLPTISRYAGSGEFSQSGDGGPALEAGLGAVSDMALGPDGSIYLSIWLDDVVRRIRPDGVIERFAGTGEEGFSGDGGPALEAQLDSPEELAVGPDGSLYIADFGNRRVRRVGLDGTITTVAGNGEFSFLLNQVGPDATAVPMPPSLIAVEANGNLLVKAGSRILSVAGNGVYTTYASSLPSGGEDMQVGPDGAVYFAVGSGSNHRVWRVVRSGLEVLFAGAGPAAYTGDGGPATEATLDDPRGLAFMGDVLFIGDSGNHVVRRVDGMGTISTFAGTGSPETSGDGGPALFAGIERPQALAYADERLYVFEAGERVIRVVDLRIDATTPKFSSAGVVNAAAFAGNALAPAEIVSIFGENLAPETAIATATPLPEELAGVRVTLTDSTGATTACALFFVAGTQINCYVSPDAATGPATLEIRTPSGASTVAVEIRATAGGLFSANATGEGVAAAAAIRVAADGAQSAVDVFSEGSPRTATPIDLGPEGEQVVLLLFGTGVRGWSTIEATIGGVPAQVIGVAAQGEFVGLDQVNVLIPRELIGAGEAEVRLTVDGQPLNVVTIRVQ